jgi:hypothetical protein
VGEGDNNQGRVLHGPGMLHPVGTNGQKRARSAASVSARKAQPWEKPADGARSALVSTRSMTSGDSGRPE